MIWEKFSISNFKGIKEVTLDLNGLGGNIYTFVGLNESGKTTILEALDFFGQRYTDQENIPIDKVNNSLFDIIPLPERRNFNGKIVVQGLFSINEIEKKKIIKNADISDFQTNRSDGLFSIEKVYTYKSSQIENRQSLWDISIYKKTRKGSKPKTYAAADPEWQQTVETIGNMLPRICYFPTFAFQIPEKIFLDSSVIENKKERSINDYFLTTLQDVLDATNPGATVKEHILSRMNDENTATKLNSTRSMEDLVYDIGRNINEQISTEWTRILGKKFSDSITLKANTDEKYLYFELEGKTKSPIIYRSLGFRWFFCFLLFTLFRGKRKDNSKVIFLLDEPASNLHSAAQKRLLNSFSKIAQDNCSIIYSTHSHYMINPNWLENTYIIENSSLDLSNSDIHKGEFDYDSSKEIAVKALRYRQFISKYPTKTSYYQPVLDVLDYKSSDLELTNNMIFVEGKTDFYTLRYFIDVVLSDQNDYKKIKITPSMNGATGMGTLISLYLGWGYNFTIILDADSKKTGAGKEAQKKYIYDYSLPREKVLCLDDINDKWNGYRIEELFTSEDKLALISSEFPETKKFDKNIFHKTILIKTGKKEIFNFSQETTSNVKELLSYMASRN